MAEIKVFTGDLAYPGEGMGFGSVPAPLMVVGDNPPKKALADGPAQFTKTVRGFWGLFQEAGLPVYFTFLVKAPLGRGKARSPVKEARRALPLLRAEINLVRPKRILVYGSHVTELLCPGFTNLRDDHGAIFYNEDLGVEVVPTFDPLVAYYDPERLEYFNRDLRRLLTVNRPVQPEVGVLDGKFPVANLAWGLTGEGPLVLDLETTGLDPRKDQITFLGLYGPAAPGVRNYPILIIQNPSPTQLRSLHAEIVRSGTTVWGHNLKFDLTFLSYATRDAWVDFPVVDTMLQARVAGERILSLKHLTAMLTDRPGPHAFGGVADVPYLVEDLLSTWEVGQALSRRVPENNPAFRLMNQMTRVFTQMYLWGVRVDLGLLGAMGGELAEKSRKAFERLAGAGQINWNSPEQVAGWLLSQGVELAERSPVSGAFSTKSVVLERLADEYEVVRSLLEYREAEKLANYVKEYQETLSAKHPYVHPNYKLTGARTGRISCENPNLQNVPPFIKKLFISRFSGGRMGVVDLDQAELRVAGILSGDQDFGRTLTSTDAHRANAGIIFGKAPEEVSDAERQEAKSAIFRLLFGGSAYGLAHKLGIPEERATEIYEKIYHRFPVLTTFLENLGLYGLKHLKITSPFGRTRDLLGEWVNRGPGAVRRTAINTPIQTTASDVTMWILVGAYYELKNRGLKSLVVSTVHDSILFDVYPGEEEALAGCVRAAFVHLNFSVMARFPLYNEIPFSGTLGVGANWYLAEKEPERTWACSTRTKAGVSDGV